MKRKALITSMALLLVAIVCLSTATYAWFTQSSTGVAANGMSVRAAAASAFLQIVNSNSEATNATKTIAAAADVPTGTDMVPVTVEYPSANTINWKYTYSDNPNSATKGATYSYTNLTSDQIESGTPYFIKNTFTINTASGSASNLMVSSVDLGALANGGALRNAVRVLIVCGNNAVIFNPRNVDTEHDVNGVSVLNGDANGYLAATVNTSNAATVDIYVFFDGEDAACYSANAITTSAISDITVNFTATPA